MKFNSHEAEWLPTVLLPKSFASAPCFKGTINMTSPSCVYTVSQNIKEHKLLLLLFTWLLGTLSYAVSLRVVKTGGENCFHLKCQFQRSNYSAHRCSNCI
ncbi:hypothetical protein XELAEV_18005471mg [Xenopus laevis]|uniref:Uncharacterized protein n=1 Tax=Xenopus laevis TaxID=8355 RepID=A0A974DZD7_XENLA|nr:hypothetical protein XELAEV_18005471mg [Xenopus laevis]